MTVRQLVTLAGLALILVAAPAVAADESDIAGRAAAWESSYNAGDYEAVAALYSDDGCRMPPNLEIVTGGPEAIVPQIEAGVEMGAARVQLAVSMAESAGDMAWARGTYEILSAAGETVDHGKWMNVSERVGGEWKIRCDIWNSDMPLPME